MSLNMSKLAAKVLEREEICSYEILNEDFLGMKKSEYPFSASWFSPGWTMSIEPWMSSNFGRQLRHQLLERVESYQGHREKLD